jgi:hypothetical protein
MIALRLLGWIWCLPVTLVGLVVGAFTRPSGFRFRWLGHHGVRGVLEFTVRRWPKDYSAFTFGAVQGYREGVDPERHRRHEDCHTLQGWLLGVFNFPAYGVCSLVSRLRGTGWYRGNALEAWARAWGRR